MNDVIQNRLKDLRSTMMQQGLSACYISTADYHLSEYVGDHFKFRAWLSGFTGSAGTLVVLKSKAGLWTDGRYFLQAENELAGTGIDLYRMGISGVPSIEEFLTDELSPGDVVALDGRTISAATGMQMSRALTAKGITLALADLAENVWQNRPPMADSIAHVYAEQFSGRSTTEKLSDVRAAMEAHHADTHILCMLDEIAWLFNFRGADVAYNPVLLSYAVVEKDAVHLFADSSKLSPEVVKALQQVNTIIHPYNEIYEYVSHLDSTRSVMVMPERLNYTLYQGIEQTGAKIVIAANPCMELKSVKNPVEISNTRYAHIKDGAAVVRFMKWLKENVPSGQLTEASAAAYLDQLRRDIPGNRGLSFTTISSYSVHGAICHYAVSEESNIFLAPHGLFLVDSGGHYDEGTTDITRTFALGPLTPAEKEHFALVLRCMLNLMYAQFPEGVFCHNLDVLARLPLWERGLDFRHGTGHGVGHLLNVHEGPNIFYWKTREGTQPTVLKPGMITTDEPGLYIDGSHGIRLENELLCVERQNTEYGRFLGFDCLTLAPIDLDAIDPSLLTEVDRQRLNDYHQAVYHTLAPELTPEEQAWLKTYTRAI